MLLVIKIVSVFKKKTMTRFALEYLFLRSAVVVVVPFSHLLAAFDDDFDRSFGTLNETVLRCTNAALAAPWRSDIFSEPLTRIDFGSASFG